MNLNKHPLPWKVSDGFYVIDANGIPVCRVEPFGLSDEAQRSAHEAAKLIASTTEAELKKQELRSLTPEELVAKFPSVVYKDGHAYVARLGHVKAGDLVTRNLCGIRQRLVVEEVTDTLIKCGGGWDFDRIAGAEVDEDLGWGPNGTGSFLEEEK